MGARGPGVLVALTLCCVIVSASFHVSPQPPVRTTRWQQEEFMVSFWVDPIVAPDQFPARYQEIKQANFNVIMGGFGALTPEAIRAQLAAGRTLGLGVLATTRLANDPVDFVNRTDGTLWGYQMKDEPSKTDFEALGDLVARSRRLHPGALHFINLLPNYAATELLGTPHYEDYVAAFVERVKPDVLSMDHYPDFGLPYSVEGNNATMAGYCRNLALFREVSLREGVPFMNFFNNMPFNNAAQDPSEAQIRWQVYTSLAYGARGVLYFTYWTPPGAGFERGGGLMQPSGDEGSPFKPGPHYAHAKALNAELQAVGPWLMQARSKAVYHATVASPTQTSVAAQLKGCVVQDLVDVPGQGDWLLGEFIMPDGRILVFINNHSDRNNAWPTVVLRSDVDMASVAEVSLSSGKEVMVRDDSPRMEGLQMALPAGSGRVLLVKVDSEAVV